MNKNGTSKTKYCIQWETHANNIFKGFCSLMEHQSLVDIVLCCGNNTIQAHKVVLAANSPLFREEFEKNPQVEQVIIHGCEFSILRATIEMMYCGRTLITEEMVRHFIAAARLFQLRILDNLFLDRPDFLQTGEEVFLPKPQFLTKKPKYPTYSFGGQQAPGAMSKSLTFAPSSAFKPYKQKKKLRLEAEQACVKEAHASRMALASLQKEIAAAPQVNSFIIEESCTETTVENFIPHHPPQQPSYVQVIEYEDLENGVYLPSGQFLPDSKPPAQLSSERIKHLLGADLPTNVEVMYKTSDGSFVAVTEEVLRTLSSKEGLQYQVVDEDGRVGEIQDLQMVDKVKLGEGHQLELEMGGSEGKPYEDGCTSASSPNDCVIVDNDKEEDMEIEAAMSPQKCETKFSPDIFFADLPKAQVDLNVEIVASTKVERLDEDSGQVLVS